MRRSTATQMKKAYRGPVGEGGMEEETVRKGSHTFAVRSQQTSVKTHTFSFRHRHIVGRGVWNESQERGVFIAWCVST